MSEVQVNKIVPATGTDVTLGDSGDTFTIPSGATITNSGTASGFGGGKLVQQVVQGSLLIRFTSSTLATWEDTGLEATITPATTGAKIWVSISNGIVGGDTINCSLGAKIQRAISGGATSYIGLPTQGSYAADSVRGWSTGEECGLAAYGGFPLVLQYLDAPSTTSAVTYTLHMINQEGGSGAYCLNGVQATPTDAAYPITSSFITLWEIAA